jgi:geranylgeranyl diphosphate synthase type I
MLIKIKNRIEKELIDYTEDVDKRYSLSSISPLLYNHIKEFLCRKGKRVRPALFLIAYLGFTKKITKGLYRAAISLELLHDFLLVHDDIIDKSDRRRGQPSLHKIFSQQISRYKNTKFNGQDLAIVAGDVIFTLALDAFLNVREDAQRKERAFKKFIQAALYTGSGEFLELIQGIKAIDSFTAQDIYKIYDLKTANYTFGYPLSIGATLAGTNKKQTDILFKYGLYLGRAFQIKDDIMGIFGEESKTGKPNLTDLKEGKKTLLIWCAYRNSNKKDKSTIKKILSGNNVSYSYLLKMSKIILKSGALVYAKGEVEKLILKARDIIKYSQMKPRYKQILDTYNQDLLKL